MKAPYKRYSLTDSLFAVNAKFNPDEVVKA